MGIKRIDPEKKTSYQWQEFLNEQNKEEIFYIYDPDGWDRLNFKYSFFQELITLSEFSKRRLVSTTVKVKK